MDKMKVGVVGVGAIGRNHARIYSESHAAELSAIFDSDAEAAREISSQYGGRVVESLEELCQMVDAASIATPTNTHRMVGEALMPGA